MFDATIVVLFNTIIMVLADETFTTEGACDVLYLVEPFPATECNPYAANSTFNLQCQVQAPGYLSSRLGILWYFTNINNETILISMKTLSSLVSIVRRNGSTVSGKLLLTSTVTFGQFLDPVHAGSYFCQISSEGDAAPFLPSVAQRFGKEAETHNNQSCSLQDLNHMQNASRCARNNSTSTTSSNSGSKSISILWLYVLVGVDIAVFTVNFVLMIVCIRLCHKRRMRAKGKFNVSQPDQGIIFAERNDAYGLREEVMTSTNAAYTRNRKTDERLDTLQEIPEYCEVTH